MDRYHPEVEPGKHPRLRGEDRGLSSARRAPSETPPLTRGRLRGVDRKRPRDGNTPAYAGKTAEGGSTPPQRPKHPRLRGEDRREARRYRARPRNTPAYAGKTATFCTKTSLTIQNTPLLIALSVFH